MKSKCYQVWGGEKHFCFTKVYTLNYQRIQHDNMVIDGYLKCLLWRETEIKNLNKTGDMKVQVLQTLGCLLKPL